MNDAAGRDFREEFGSWAELREHVAAAARFPEYGVERALQQVLVADLTSHLPGVDDGDWLLLGSLSLPCRIPVDWSWRHDGAPATPGVDLAYVLPRAAFDLDLFAVDLARRSPSDQDEAAAFYGREVAHVFQNDVADGLGLGGLIRWEPDLRVLERGQVMGLMHAVPVDPRDASRPVDDPISIEIDVKPAHKVNYQQPPDEPLRPFLGVDVPGLTAPRLPLLPSENVFADKASLLTGPPASARRGAPAGPWHRYKDVFDLYFMTEAVPLRAEVLQEAMDSNWNYQRMERPGTPHPYRLYGDTSLPGDTYARNEPTVPWDEGCRRIVEANPQLATYPDFRGMRDQVATCVDTARVAPAGAVWSPTSQWQAPQAARGWRGYGRDERWAQIVDDGQRRKAARDDSTPDSARRQDDTVVDLSATQDRHHRGPRL